MKRTADNMVRKRNTILRQMEREREAGLPKRVERAVKRARRAGVLLDCNIRCGYVAADDDNNNWIIGPDPQKDNIYQAIPQVSLHGFDEGLVQKLNYGALEMCITYCQKTHKMTAAQVITCKNACQCYIMMTFSINYT
jgi:hypothetical protein